MPELRVKDLTYLYDPKTDAEKEALDSVSLDVKRGEVIALVGKTGSGKSTLVQNIDALLIPTSGQIYYPNGMVIDQSPIVKRSGKVVLRKPKKIKEWKKLRKSVGLMFQFAEMQLFETTVFKDVLVGPKNFGLDEATASKNARDALRLVGIPSSYYERSPFELSGGEKRRVAIAGVLAYSPDILILDEPTVGLDPEGASLIMEAIMKKNEQGTTVVFITHDMDFALAHASRMAVLADGKVLSYKKPYEVFQEEDVLQKASLVLPEAFAYAVSLLEAGMDIDLSKVKDAKSLAGEIARCRA